MPRTRYVLLSLSKMRAAMISKQERLADGVAAPEADLDADDEADR